MYTLIKKGTCNIVNNLSYELALDLAQEGDIVLTIKNNYVTAIREIEPNSDVIEFKHTEGIIKVFNEGVLNDLPL